MIGFRFSELSVLSPPALRLNQIMNETLPSEPILLITTPGSDPSSEWRQLATSKSIDQMKEVGTYVSVQRE